MASASDQMLPRLLLLVAGCSPSCRVMSCQLIIMSVFESQALRPSRTSHTHRPSPILVPVTPVTPLGFGQLTRPSPLIRRI